MITNSRKKMFNKAFSTLVFVYGIISLALALPKSDRLKRNDESSFQSNEAAPVYLLVSTSSKIYCMKMPDEFDQLQQQQPQPQLNQQQQQLYYYRNNYYDRDSKNFAIIYEEKNHQNNWITDAFYVKSENLIYVNVYNSTSATSDIFTLKYDQMRDVWIKNVLYRDQSYCLGITYNEKRKELYWTAAKSIVSGSSQLGKSPSTGPQLNHVLFKLQAAKKLLYLKFDTISDTIYVSTLNYVYACSLHQTQRDDCRIIARDLQSARGLFLDSVNRFLYVVDHKKKVIKRINLDIQDSTENTANNMITTVLSSETTPDIGDIFYMTIYDKLASPRLVWSEFSGKIKMSNLNDASNFKLLFSTNEYTYSINLMDNSTMNLNPATRSSTLFMSSSTTSIITTSPPLPIPSTSSTESILTSRLIIQTTTPVLTTTPQIKLKYRNELPSTTQPLLSWTRHRTSQSSDTTYTRPEIFSTRTQSAPLAQETTTELDNQILITTFGLDNHENEQEENEEEFEDEDDIATVSIEAKTVPYIVTSTTLIPKTTIQIEEVKDRNLKFRQNVKVTQNDEDLEEESKDENSNQIQNFKAINLIKTTEILGQNEDSRLITQKPSFQVDQRATSSSSFTLSRSSPQLNVALYIVICLLCFSLIINIILLYVSKMKQSREKLIITHEICSKPLVNTPSQRSGINSTKTSNSDDLADCNMNLINTNGSATSGIDGEN